MEFPNPNWSYETPNCSMKSQLVLRKDLGLGWEKNKSANNKKSYVRTWANLSTEKATYRLVSLINEQCTFCSF